ncbi:potassium/sodium eff [Aaosphaeria arxii CBS 175.79]|uniref:P-type Na(+) transporter n=1 Tax=Aaosphaeria arxii CBS 175.79 TaxID=1450172 RepID=A0A6A5XMD4_9PLEO|nr:potassium/sodium eff [Aaosphaeria arxii CBS 175.79]KAF2014302.1 potassium/sodium eff [Aaosphaeria arxii CBS 175.79]
MGKNKAITPHEGHVSGQSNKPLSLPAHSLTLAQVVDELSTDTWHGLDTSEAKRRLDEHGANDLGETKGVSVVKILIAQVANAMTLVLILAMAVSFGIRSWIEGGVVTFVILLNIVVGFFQEWSAEKTMDSLRSLSSPTAKVIRDGKQSTIPSLEVVPGDVIEIKTGDTIPADIRVFEAVNFETDEALLTGESLPVRKNEEATFPEKTGPGDRINVAYSSSNVTKGRAKGVVFATGVYTEIGAIASQLRETESKVRPVKNRGPSGHAKPHRYLEAYTLTFTDAIGRFLGLNVGTPLQKKLSKLAILLFGIAVLCAIIVLAANEFSSRQEVVIYAVATGLSMIPASLVVVLTITMAAGTKSMEKRNVLVRNLKSLEALGGVTDICSDKTGTLTQGKMIARGAWLPGVGTYTIENSTAPQDPTAGDVRFSSAEPRRMQLKTGGSACGDIVDSEKLHSRPDVALQHFLNVACLANIAAVKKNNEGAWEAHGDPTEIAIQVFAARFGMDRSRLTKGGEAEWEDLVELPFDSTVKKMSVIMRHSSGNLIALTKGAVERVIASCSSVSKVGLGDELEDMTDDFCEEILRNMEALASLGLRVLALASRPYEGQVEKGADVDRQSVESGLIFRGLIGLYDPPRPESSPAVRQCHEAGIEVHMLTGDHPETAKAIAVEVGILPSAERMKRISADVAKALIMTAGEFDSLTDDEVDKLPVLPLVIARCAPSTKVRMIEALHRRGRFCAMTGDGVNDSPSLKRADVGIAMGQAGSDVAKEASDIVLTDDNFASILAAVEEGRRIFDNIQKFVLHVLAENVAQAGTLLVGLAFKDNTGLSVFPLAPVQVVWIIMATSGMPDMGLGFERAVPDILHRPPVSLKTGIFTLEFLVDMVVYGLWITLLCLSSFTLVVYGFGDGELGSGCNETYSSSCHLVFRARATTFACLTWFALFLAWEMIDMRRSFFRMQPDSTKYFTQWIIDIWRNRFLFWAVVVGFVTLFPLVYIPVVNTTVFKHAPITWEWGIVFVSAGLFFAGVEAWKWAKRVYFRRQEKMQRGARHEDMDVEDRVFGRYYTDDSSVTNEEKV